MSGAGPGPAGEAGGRPLPNAVRVSERFYRRLVSLYPARYRREYGPPMVQLFRDLCRDAYRHSRGRGVLGVWLRVAPDLGASLGAEYLSEWRRWKMNKPVSERMVDPAAALGLLLAGVLLAAGVLVKALILRAGGSVLAAALISLGLFLLGAVIMEFFARTQGTILLASALYAGSLLLPTLWVPDTGEWLRENPAGVGVVIFIAGIWTKRSSARWPVFAVALILAAAHILISFLD